MKDETFKYYDGQMLTSRDIKNLRKIFETWEQQVQELKRESNDYLGAWENQEEENRKLEQQLEEKSKEAEQAYHNGFEDGRIDGYETCQRGG